MQLTRLSAPLPLPLTSFDAPYALPSLTATRLTDTHISSTAVDTVDTSALLFVLSSATIAKQTLIIEHTDLSLI